METTKVGGGATSALVLLLVAGLTCGACSSSTKVKSRLHLNSQVDESGRVRPGSHLVCEYHENYSPDSLFFEIKDGGKNTYLFITIRDKALLTVGAKLGVKDKGSEFWAMLQSDPAGFRTFGEKRLRGFAQVLSYDPGKSVVMKLALEIKHGDKYYPFLRREVSFRR